MVLKCILIIYLTIDLLFFRLPFSFDPAGKGVETRIFISFVKFIAKRLEPSSLVTITGILVMFEEQLMLFEGVRCEFVPHVCLKTVKVVCY